MFTISAGYHVSFDALRISLHPIGDDNSNTYEIHIYPPNKDAEYGLPARVTLTDATGGQVPLPSRRYFQIHDAKIAYLSGVGKIMEQIFQDVKDARILAEDRGSHLLSLALLSSLQT